MREHSKMLLALVGSVAACFSMYSILKKTSQVSPKPNRAEAFLTAQALPCIFFYKFNHHCHKRNKEQDSHDTKEFSAYHCRYQCI